jgi:hypothetical protein
MTTWVSIMSSQPADGDTVWIRRLPIFDTPAQATWTASTATFTLTAPPITMDVPWYEVHSWRPL